MTILDVTAPACASDAGSVCQWMWDHTGLDFFALHADAALTSVVHILLILLISWLARALIYRAINHLTRMTADGETPALLRPLRAPARRALNRAVSAERRRQRALETQRHGHRKMVVLARLRCALFHNRRHPPRIHSPRNRNAGESNDAAAPNTRR